jgi:putative endonuclease
MGITKIIGDAGESLAVQYLEGIGYAVIQRNFRTKYGELDIVARYGELVVIIEVKTRKDAEFADASDSVTSAKRKKIRKTALCWLMLKRDESPVRFDIIEVYSNGKINHIEDAFQ